MEPPAISAFRPPIPALPLAVTVPSPTEAHQSEGVIPTAEVRIPVAPMSWKERGEYHLERKELDLSINAFTKALQEAEKNANPELIGESLKDLGRAFL